MQYSPYQDYWYEKFIWWCMIGMSVGLLMGLMFGSIILER